MKVLCSIFVAFVMFLLLNISANAQGLEIYGIGSSDFQVIPCELICPECPDEICPCFCADEVLVTNEISPFLGESAFYKISPNTGNPDFIGYTGFAACRGLDIHPLSGDFYAVCNRLEVHQGPPGPPGPSNPRVEGEGVGQVLVHIDENTGEGTEIGPLGDGIGFLRGSFVSDISFHPNGTLYAHLNSFGPIYMVPLPALPEVETSNGVIENTLGTIDLLTGDFEPIGPTNSDDFLSAIGFDTQLDLIQCANFNNFRKMAFDETSNLINDSFTNINSLNLGTGNATFLRKASFPSEVLGHLNAIASKDVDVETGIFYGFLQTEDLKFIGNAGIDTSQILVNGSYLVRIDPDNGNVEVIGLTSPPFEDFLAIATKRTARNVPTMSEYGLMATAVLLLGASALYLRRRQARLEA